MTDQRSLFLVRHGEATSKEENPERPLTGEGRRGVERLACWAAAAGIRPDRIVHSGKLRAGQTAEILAQHLDPQNGVIVRAGLDPNDDPGPLADSLVEIDRPLLLVGHLPFLGRLVSRLVLDDPDRPLVRFEAAGLVGLLREEGRWTVECIIHPGLLPS